MGAPVWAIKISRDDESVFLADTDGEMLLPTDEREKAMVLTMLSKALSDMALINVLETDAGNALVLDEADVRRSGMKLV